jgi:hypothetical protein
MGANAELDIFLKKGAFSLKRIFSLLEMEGLSLNIREMTIFDDWYYTNQAHMNPDAIERDLDNIFWRNLHASLFLSTRGGDVH